MDSFSTVSNPETLHACPFRFDGTIKANRSCETSSIAIGLCQPGDRLIEQTRVLIKKSIVFISRFQANFFTKHETEKPHFADKATRQKRVENWVQASVGLVIIFPLDDLRWLLIKKACLIIHHRYDFN